MHIKIISIKMLEELENFCEVIILVTLTSFFFVLTKVIFKIIFLKLAQFNMHRISKINLI